MRLRSRLSFLIVAAGLLAAVAAGVTAAGADGWWIDNGGGPSSSHFSPFDQIDKSNVNQLQVAWYYPFGATGFNPIVVDDVMYVSGRNDSLIALDATTGKELWIHDGLTGLSARGINFWRSKDGSDQRIIFNQGVFLQEIDAKTGKLIPTFGQDGAVDMRDGLARGEYGFRMPNPGRVFENEIIVGMATGEGWLSPAGDIRAYDVITGKRLWQFHTMPQPGEYGYDTYESKNAYKYVGGNNNWGEMSIDETRGIAYIPTGSATYDFYGADRIGQNLYANCLIALDVRTGRRLWHFQTIHHDLWDLDNVSAPQLATVMHDGKKVDVVAHAGKTGFLYVFNRVTGEPLWPIEERPVPPSDVPGEFAWPTQPFPTAPPPFARQYYGVEDVNRWLLSPQEQEELRARVVKARNGTGPQGSLFIPPAVGEDSISMPGNQGGSNWGTTGADPDKGLVFVLGIDEVAILKLQNVMDTNLGARGAGPGGPGAAAYAQYCSPCHGANLQNPLPGIPNLSGVTSRLAEDAIQTMVTNGGGNMRPVPGITDLEINAIVDFLQSGGRAGGAGAGRGRGAGSTETYPPGPIVQTGGAPVPTVPTRTGPTFGGRGPTGGDAAYPEDVNDAPKARYSTGYNVMGTSTAPPYSRLTAYDLNTGTIKWQVPVGDHPATMARGGPANTGSVGLRTGIMPTKSGIVFLAGGDGKLRAYDEDNGKVLWTGDLGGTGRGIPVMYMSKGRQYLVVVSQPSTGGGGGGGRGAAPGLSAGTDQPRGFIAFALPQK